MVRLGSFACLFVCACVVDLSPPNGHPGTDAGSGSGSGSDPVTSAVVVSEPPHGTVVKGDPVGLSLHVAGVYSDTSTALTVQVLADPNDLNSWTSIGTTQATDASGTGFAFAVDVRPVPTAADSARWPAGGVLRLRVVDDAGVALPRDASSPQDTVIGLVDATTEPTTWTYLTEKPVGSTDETTAYYTAINAPATLTDFQTQYQLTGNETTARYFNVGDLGIGRDMHCAATTTPAGGVACWVSNYGTFGGLRSDALAQLLAASTPLATVAMVYTPPLSAPNAVTFMVYGPTGALAPQAQLDTHGDNTSIPQNCLNCHGGRATYDTTTHAAIGARFLPFDPASFAYLDDPKYTLAAQQGQLHDLDVLVATTSPTDAMLEILGGMWPSGAQFDDTFVPAGWSDTPSDARVYREVVKPYCRSCHTTFDKAGGDPSTFATAAGLRAQGAMAVSKICGAGPHGMPTAQATAAAMYGSSARALLLTWLDAPGACAP